MKKYQGLIILGAAALIVFLILIITGKKEQEPATDIPQNGQAQVSVPTTSPLIAQTLNLDISPNPVAARVNNASTVEVIINTDKPLLVADLILDYDPAVLQVQKVETGDLFIEVQEFINKIDNAKGQILFTSGSRSGSKTGQSTIATVAFTALKPVNSTLFTLHQNSLAADMENNPISLKAGTDFIINAN